MRVGNMTNNQSSIINHHLSIVLVVLVLAGIFAIGHFGLRPLIFSSPRMAGVEAGLALEDVPPPPDSRLARAMNDRAGAGRAMLLYVSRGSASSVAEYYRREMPARGWRAAEPSRTLNDSAGQVLAFADPTGVWCIISVVEAGAGGGSTVALMRLAADPNSKEGPQ